MPDQFDPAALIARFRERAEAVKSRQLPPVGGNERQRFLAQKQVDFMDFAMIGDAEAVLVDSVLILTIDLRPAGGS